MISCKQTIYTGNKRITGDQPHSGDAIWSLAHLQSLNQPVEYFLKCETQQLYNELESIIKIQPYIDNVYEYRSGVVDIDFDDRNRYDTSQCICDIYGSSNHDTSWLFHEFESKQYNIIYRNTRYRNEMFDWRKYKEQLDLSNCIFIGSYTEYVSFRMSASIPRSKLEWVETKTYLELYKTIAQCNMFYGNGGLPCVMAHGLGKPVVLEIELHRYTPHDPVLHNVMNRKHNEYYVQYNGDNIKQLKIQA